MGSANIDEDLYRIDNAGWIHPVHVGSDAHQTFHLEGCLQDGNGVRDDEETVTEESTLEVQSVEIRGQSQ